MSDVPPPSTPPPPGGPPGAVPPPVSTEPPGTIPPPRKGLSTGMKVAIGCGVALLLLLIVLFAFFGLAARFVGNKVDDFETAMQDQERAGERAEELEREHAFTPPPDGTLEEGVVDKFFAVTDDTWEEIEDWARDMGERSRRMEAEGSEAGFGDAMAGLRGMAGGRAALVEALDEHDMAPSAYVWTGFQLMHAHEAVKSGGTGAGMPERNLEIARAHADRLAELEDEGDGGEAGKGVVLAMAYMYFPRADVFVPPGVDTTVGQP
jgi:hypothetical protein